MRIYMKNNEIVWLSIGSKLSSIVAVQTQGTMDKPLSKRWA